MAWNETARVRQSRSGPPKSLQGGPGPMLLRDLPPAQQVQLRSQEDRRARTTSSSRRGRDRFGRAVTEMDPQVLSLPTSSVFTGEALRSACRGLRSGFAGAASAPGSPGVYMTKPGIHASAGLDGHTRNATSLRAVLAETLTPIPDDIGLDVLAPSCREEVMQDISSLRGARRQPAIFHGRGCRGE
jgi:hypothetical protein